MMDEPCADCPDDEATAPTIGPDRRGTKVTMWGPTMLAPIGKPTGDKRRFAAHSLTNRELPLPLTWQRERGQGHEGSVTVGTLHGIRYDENGAPHGFGLLFQPDPEQLPRLAQDVAEAKMLLDQKVVGPSVDLDSMEYHALDPEDAGQYAAEARPEIEVDKGRISAATLVPIPAFAEARPFPLTELDPGEWDKVLADYATETAALTASVRGTGWAEMPLASADTEWSAGAAVARLREHGGDALARACLWSDGADHRFPLADVVDGQLALVPGAVEAALAVLDAGTSVLPEADQAAMRRVLLNLRPTEEDPDLVALAIAVRSMSDADFDDLAEAAEGAGTFGARFDALMAKLKGRVANAGAVAASIGRHKYGAKGMARLRAGVAASKVKPLHGAVTASAYLEALTAAALSGDWAGIDEHDLDALVASAVATDAPPRAWFDDPKLTKPTAVTVTEDGRIFGHVSDWKTPHIGFPGQFRFAPKSHTGYAYFHTGEIVTDGGPVAVGRVTIGTGHASTADGFGMRAAVEHYDNTGRQAAVVRAGEDKHGIWVAGAVVPGANVAELRRSPLSGDWRRIGGNLEMVGVLGVNTPGFPIPRALVASGEIQALVAAGVVPCEGGPVPSTMDIPALVAATVAETRRQDAMEARRTAALGTLAHMDDEREASELAERKLRTSRAVLALRG